MITWQQFTPELVQAVAFIAGFPEFVTGKAVAAVLAKFSDRFSGEMQILPIPPGMPPEIPRIVMQSADKFWRLQMGPARVDSVWTRLAGDPLPSLVELTRKCADVVEHYAEVESLRVNRLALVIQRAYRTEKAAQELIAQFCNDRSQREPFNRSESFEIHNHKVYIPVGLEHRINSWVRCKSVILSDRSQPAILVEQDLNIFAQEPEKLRFNVGQMRAFFDTMPQEADGILQKYFPEGVPT